MKAKFTFVLILGFLLISGCTSPPPPNLALKAIYLVPGKTSSKEVITLLGKPKKIVKLSSGEELWIYQSKGAELKVFIKNFKVARRSYDERE